MQRKQGVSHRDNQHNVIDHVAVRAVIKECSERLRCLSSEATRKSR